MTDIELNEALRDLIGYLAEERGLRMADRELNGQDFDQLWHEFRALVEYPCSD